MKTEMTKEQMCEIATVGGQTALASIRMAAFAVSLRCVFINRPGDYLNAEKLAFAAETALHGAGQRQHAFVLKHVAGTFHAARVGSQDDVFAQLGLVVQALTNLAKGAAA